MFWYLIFLKIVLLVKAHMRTSTSEPEPEPPEPVIFPGAGAGAGAAEKFYSEPEPVPEPEYFPRSRRPEPGADQKCHGSVSLIYVFMFLFTPAGARMI